MSLTTPFINDVQLPLVSTPYKENVIENATDVVTLDGSLHTDFVSQRQGFELRWDVMTLDEYETIRAFYDGQFTGNDYVLFTDDYYDVTDVPCRMYINDRDVRVMGCEVYDVEVKLVRNGASIVTS